MGVSGCRFTCSINIPCVSLFSLTSSFIMKASDHDNDRSQSAISTPVIRLELVSYNNHLFTITSNLYLYTPCTPHLFLKRKNTPRVLAKPVQHICKAFVPASNKLLFLGLFSPLKQLTETGPVPCQITAPLVQHILLYPLSARMKQPVGLDQGVTVCKQSYGKHQTLHYVCGSGLGFRNKGCRVTSHNRKFIMKVRSQS